MYTLVLSGSFFLLEVVSITDETKFSGANGNEEKADHEQEWQPYPVDPYSCYNM